MNQLNERARVRLRGGVVSLVFQEPVTALDPVYTGASRSSRRSCSTAASSAAQPAPGRARTTRCREECFLPQPEVIAPMVNAA